jgi:precorrin-2 dehydrogenase / sirohydrochlorin ferrochelatase
MFVDTRSLDMIHLLLDLKGKKAVVFGGGEVGLRKAKYLASEAEVTVVSRQFVPGFIGSDVRQVVDDIDRELITWVEGADLVVAATNDPELNGRIAALAREKGRPCNRADGPSTFLIPSVVVRENYSVAISTGGRSPGMAKFLRLKLDDLLGPQYDGMVRLQEELRSAARSTIPEQRERERFLWEVLEDPAVWDLLGSDPAAAKALALRRLGERHG